MRWWLNFESRMRPVHKSVLRVQLTRSHLGLRAADRGAWACAMCDVVLDVWSDAARSFGAAAASTEELVSRCIELKSKASKPSTTLD